MPRVLAGVRGDPRPFDLIRAGSATASVNLLGALTVLWSTGGGTLALVPNTPTGLPTLLSDNTTRAIDTTLYNWSLLAVEALGLRYVKESDYPANVDTIIGNNTHRWCRVASLYGALLVYPTEMGA